MTDSAKLSDVDARMPPPAAKNWVAAPMVVCVELDALAERLERRR